MGFGLLFVGYFMTYLMSVSYGGYLIRLAGYAFMLSSFKKLCGYNHSFRFPFYASFAMLGITALDCYAKIGRFLYDSLIIETFSLPEGFDKTLGSVDDVLTFLFHACLLYAIYKIAKETEVGKISYAAARNFIMLCIYEVLCAISYHRLPLSRITRDISVCR